MKILLAVVMAGAAAASAFAGIDVRLTDAGGKPVSADAFQVDVNCDTTVDGIETAVCKVRSGVDGKSSLRLVGRVALDGKATLVYDGHDALPLNDAVARPFFKDDAFMMGAVWGGVSEATAFALGADCGVAAADFTATKAAMEISVPMTFSKKGAEREVVFHAFPFVEIYGAHDAFARYYSLYPRRFQRDSADGSNVVRKAVGGGLTDDDKRPFPLHGRHLAGERDVLACEDFPSDQDVPDPARRHLAACRAVRRSFFTGEFLPTASLKDEWPALASHAHARMNAAGWKPVTGVVAADEDSEVARYGLGTDAWIALNNLKRETRQLSVDVFSGELFSGRAGRRRNGGCLFAPFFGGVATNILASEDARVTCKVGPLLANVLEAVAGVRGTGTLTAQWSGSVGAPVLRVESVDFTGDVFFNASADNYQLADAQKHKLKPGSSVRVKYRDAWMDGVVAVARAARHLGETDIVRSADDEANEQAARIVRFFNDASGNRKLEPKVVVESSLAPRTVKVAGFAIAGCSLREFANRVDRFLNALNWIRYPQYRPEVRMESADRSLFRLYRP